MIIKRFQFRIRFFKVCVTLKLDIRREDADGIRRRAQVDGNAVEELLIIGLVAGPKPGVAGGADPLEVRIGQGLIRLPFLHGILVEAVETGGIDHIKRRFPYTFQLQGIIKDLYGSAGHIGREPGAEMDAALRVIPVFIRTDLVVRVIVWVGVPGGITIHRQAFLRGLDFMRERRFQPYAGAQGRFGYNMYDNGGIRRRGEGLATE